jgi:hypothetical protein
VGVIGCQRLVAAACGRLLRRILHHRPDNAVGGRSSLSPVQPVCIINRSHHNAGSVWVRASGPAMRVGLGWRRCGL